MQKRSARMQPMIRTVISAALLSGVPVVALAQSAAAPLVVTATVVSTCKVDVPPSAATTTFATMPVSVTCAKGSATPRVERPTAPPARSEVRDALLVIDF
jgi:hypothetical protein